MSRVRRSQDAHGREDQGEREHGPANGPVGAAAGRKDERAQPRCEKQRARNGDREKTPGTEHGGRQAIPGRPPRVQSGRRGRAGRAANGRALRSAARRWRAPRPGRGDAERGMGAVDAAEQEIDAPGDGQPRDGADGVPGEVLPGGIAAEEPRGVDDFLARAGCQRQPPADRERLPPRIDEPRRADAVASGGDPGADVEVKRLVARDPRVGVVGAGRRRKARSPRRTPRRRGSSRHAGGRAARRRQPRRASTRRYASDTRASPRTRLRVSGLHDTQHLGLQDAAAVLIRGCARRCSASVNRCTTRPPCALARFDPTMRDVGRQERARDGAEEPRALHGLEAEGRRIRARDRPRSERGSRTSGVAKVARAEGPTVHSQLAGHQTPEEIGHAAPGPCSPIGAEIPSSRRSQKRLTTSAPPRVRARVDLRRQDVDRPGREARCPDTREAPGRSSATMQAMAPPWGSRRQISAWAGAPSPARRDRRVLVDRRPTEELAIAGRHRLVEPGHSLYDGRDMGRH